MGIFRPDAGGGLLMKTIRLFLLLPALLLPAWPAQVGNPPVAGEYYHAIEINGTLCGYSKFTATPLLQDGRKILLLKHEILMQVNKLARFARQL
jgi:hypothetical protein